MDYTLAIDQGTHASRARVFDAGGRCIAAGAAAVDLVRPQAGHAEQDSRQLLSSVQTAAHEALASLSVAQRRSVGSCGIATQRSTVVAWREDGTPLSPALSWQDTRGAACVDRLQAHADSIRRISGLPLSPHYGASKLRWLMQTHRGRDDVVLGPLAAFLLRNLTRADHSLVDHSNAQRLQLLDIHTRRWSPELLGWFDVPGERLPDCRPVLYDYGSLSDSGIPVTAVCGDQNAAWFGDAAADTGSALINLGSGAFILAAMPQADLAPELLASIAVSRDGGASYLAEGTVNGAASALQWLQQRHPDSDILAQLPAWLSQDLSPPVFINSVGGLGSPWWESRLPPDFHPSNTRHTPGGKAVAVAESILFLLQDNLTLLQRFTDIRRLRVSGGLSRIDALCQKLADLTGLPVARSDHSEASARGVAWLAARQPDWPAADAAQLFRPRSDSGLKTRYRQFREQLQLRLENLRT